MRGIPNGMPRIRCGAYSQSKRAYNDVGKHTTSVAVTVGRSAYCVPRGARIPRGVVMVSMTIQEMDGKAPM